MKTLASLAALALLALTSAPAADVKPPAGFRALFNGKDLTGWTPKIRGEALGENYGDTFRVEDGLLKVVYDPAKYPTFGEKFGHLFFAEPFSRYKLRVEYRFVGEQCPGGPGWAVRNSGVMLHGEDPAGMTLDQVIARATLNPSRVFGLFHDRHSRWNNRSEEHTSELQSH